MFEGNDKKIFICHSQKKWRVSWNLVSGCTHCTNTSHLPQMDPRDALHHAHCVVNRRWLTCCGKIFPVQVQSFRQSSTGKYLYFLRWI